MLVPGCQPGGREFESNDHLIYKNKKIYIIYLESKLYFFVSPSPPAFTEINRICLPPSRGLKTDVLPGPVDTMDTPATGSILCRTSRRGRVHKRAVTPASGKMASSLRVAPQSQPAVVTRRSFRVTKHLSPCFVWSYLAQRRLALPSC